MQNDSRDIILNKIRKGLESAQPFFDESIPEGEPVFNFSSDTQEIVFAQELQKIGGKFIFCLNYKEFVSNLSILMEQESWSSIYCADRYLQNFLTEADVPFDNGQQAFDEVEVAITRCEYLGARTGSVLVSSAHDSGRRIYAYAPVHIVVAFTSQVCRNNTEAIEKLMEKYGDDLPSFFSFITGPSRTADIEKTLIMGAHGPRELYVFLMNDNEEL